MSRAVTLLPNVAAWMDTRRFSTQRIQAPQSKCRKRCVPPSITIITLTGQRNRVRTSQPVHRRVVVCPIARLSLGIHQPSRSLSSVQSFGSSYCERDSGVKRGGSVRTSDALLPRSSSSESRSSLESKSICGPGAPQKQQPLESQKLSAQARHAGTFLRHALQ